jgi:tetratricopeptide (TPR) repeat protein
VDGAQHINPSDSYYGVALKALKAADRSKFADELQGIVKHLEDIEERTLELAASLSVLALIHLDLGRIDEARLYAARAREIVERPFPAVRADVVLATSILGRFSLRLYDIAEAEKLIGRAASLSNALRRDDYVVFVAIANLASLMHQAGRAQKAEELSNQALTIAKETSISSSDPQVLRLERQLGEIYLNEQRYYESERQLDYVLAKSVTELGPTHLQVAYAHLSLAELYKVQARYAESERHHQQAIRVLRTLAPSGTLQEANTLTSLGDLYLYMGRYQEAELVLKPALAYKESVFGKDHPALVVVLHNLGALYGYQQRYGEAELVHQRVITLKENALGPEHPDLVLSFNSIANVYLEQGRFAEAKNYFARCVAIMEKFSPPREPLPNCLSGLAIVLKNQGEIEEAEKVQFQVLEVWRQLVGTNHPDYAISQFNIARIYDAQDRRNEADHWYNEALVTAERVMGADHPTLASWLEAYAHFLRRTGQGSHADVVNARAEAIRAKSD